MDNFPYFINLADFIKPFVVRVRDLTKVVTIFNFSLFIIITGFVNFIEALIF